MNLEVYEYEYFQDRLEYEFYSLGPKRRIKKLVQFKKTPTNVGDMYNIGFGDWDEKGNFLNDSIRSNNGDTDKVLATVAHIVLDFTNKNPNAEVLAAGTAERIRLYRMNITRQFVSIYTFFNIFGLTEDNVIEPLIKSKKYVAFIVKQRPIKRIYQHKS
jgi:hypothetical protein